MWIFYASIVTSVVHLAAADDIAVTCGSCTGGGSELKGVLNGKLTVFYTIHATEFTLLKITYNGTNEMAISGLNRNVNTDKVTDRRLIVPNSITKHGTGDGATYTLNITLRKLRLADNGVTFTYSYTDSNVKTFTGETVVTVEVTPEPSASGNGSSDVTIIIIVVIVVLLIIAIMILLYKKGIIPTDACLNMCRGKREKVSTSDDTANLPRSQDGDPVKYTPKSYGEAQTEYAELGPGGRLNNVPKDKPDKSMYAEVKTDNVHYPDPRYEEPASVIV